MNGWRLVASLLFAFGSGWIICSWRSLIRYEHWMRRALAAEANTDHTVCIARHAAQADYIDHLETGGNVAGEAEDYLRDGGS